jgi:hypothetical protein
LLPCSDHLLSSFWEEILTPYSSYIARLLGEFQVLISVTFCRKGKSKLLFFATFQKVAKTFRQAARAIVLGKKAAEPSGIPSLRSVSSSLLFAFLPVQRRPACNGEGNQSALTSLLLPALE